MVEDRQSRIAWQTVNKVSRRKSTAKAKLRMHLWKQYLKNLLGKPLKVMDEPITKIISNQLNIKLEQSMLEELLVLRKIKNRKAGILNEIPPEIWKTRKFDDILV